jgi:hypothetical protein
VSRVTRASSSVSCTRATTHCAAYSAPALRWGSILPANACSPWKGLSQRRPSGPSLGRPLRIFATAETRKFGTEVRTDVVGGGPEAWQSAFFHPFLNFAGAPHVGLTCGAFDFDLFVLFCQLIHYLLWNPHFQKHACKLSGMNSSETLDLKLFRMSICRKRGRGVPHSRATSKTKRPSRLSRDGRK